MKLILGKEGGVICGEADGAGVTETGLTVADLLASLLAWHGSLASVSIYISHLYALCHHHLPASPCLSHLLLKCMLSSSPSLPCGNLRSGEGSGGESLWQKCGWNRNSERKEKEKGEGRLACLGRQGLGGRRGEGGRHVAVHTPHACLTACFLFLPACTAHITSLSHLSSSSL